MMRPLTTDLTRVKDRPYFLWDDDVSVEEMAQALHGRDGAQADLHLARLLREARYEDVWRFVTPQEVADRLEAVQPRLGRSRSFWRFIIQAWRECGLVT